MAASDNKLLLIILAIIFPPIAVLIKKGLGTDLLINIILCLLIYFPGIIHALWVVTKQPTLNISLFRLPQRSNLNYIQPRPLGGVADVRNALYFSRHRDGGVYVIHIHLLVPSLHKQTTLKSKPRVVKSKNPFNLQLRFHYPNIFSIKCDSPMTHAVQNNTHQTNLSSPQKSSQNSPRKTEMISGVSQKRIDSRKSSHVWKNNLPSARYIGMLTIIRIIQPDRLIVFPCRR